MRDLREAMKQGPRATLNSATHLPRRHPLAFGLTLATLAAVILIGGYVDNRSDINRLRPKVVQIERTSRADPCVNLSQAVKHGAGVKRTTRLTAQCVTFLNALGDLISHGLACDILKAGGIICRPAIRPTIDEVARGGDASQPAPAGQKQTPADAGDRGGSRGSGPKRGQRAPKKPTATAPPAPAPIPVVPLPSPPPSAGNSGATPAAEKSQGIQACVNVVASACVKADAELSLP